MTKTVVIYDEGFEPSPCETILKTFGSNPVRVYSAYSAYAGPWVVSDTELTEEQVLDIVQGDFYGLTPEEIST